MKIFKIYDIFISNFCQFCIKLKLRKNDVNKNKMEI